MSFIDVPGHERFVRNMLAGIGGIDLLMMVVAADESIMPQTREHFDICRLIGITSGIVVLTKTDMVDEKTLQAARQDIAELVAGSFLEGAPVYAVSAKTGAGMDLLKAGLQERLRSLEQRRPSGIFRLPVDRVFSLKGHGTVVTGTLIAGRSSKDQTVEILPSHRRARVRSIHAHDESVEEAFAGQRTAVNLLSIEKEDIARGDVLTEPDILESTSLLDVRITLLQDAPPLTHNALVRLHHQASDPMARVTLLGHDTLLPGDTGYAQVRLQHPLLALHGDRFIIRRNSPPVTIGGGVIVDHLPQKRVRRSDAAALQRLQKLENAAPEERLAIAVAQKGIHCADEKYLRAALALDLQTLRALRSAEVRVLREHPLLCVSMAAEARIQQRLQETTAAFHEKNPLLPGIPKEELRTRFLSALSPEAFAASLDVAVARGTLQVEKDVVGLAGRRVALSKHEAATAASVEKTLLQFELEFPGFEEVAKQAGRKVEEVKKIMYLLVRENKAVKLNEDYFVSRDAWERLKSTVRELKTAQKTFSVPDFKKKFGLSRKYAIPLLELLDREGVTRRIGNERIIL